MPATSKNCRLRRGPERVSSSSAKPKAQCRRKSRRSISPTTWPMRALELRRREAAVHLVDAGLVAGQRHHLAGLGQPGEQRAEALGRLRPPQPPRRPVARRASISAASGTPSAAAASRIRGVAPPRAAPPRGRAAFGLVDGESVGHVSALKRRRGAALDGPDTRSNRSRNGCAGSNPLDAGEALELRMAEIERLVLSGVAMGVAELLGRGPGLGRPPRPARRCARRRACGRRSRARAAGGSRRSPPSRRAGSCGCARPSSKAASEPGSTLKRFIATNIGRSPCGWLGSEGHGGRTA